MRFVKNLTWVLICCTLMLTGFLACPERLDEQVMKENGNIKIIKALGKAFGEALESGNPQGIEKYMTEDVQWVLPGPKEIPYTGTYIGHEGFSEFFKNLQETVNLTGGESKEYIAQGDKVVSLGFEKGTAKATGKSYEYKWAQVYTITESKVSEMYQYFNPISILDALKDDSN